MWKKLWNLSYMRSYIASGLINQCTTKKLRGNSLIPRPPLCSLILRSGMCDALHNALLKSECKHVRGGVGGSESQKSKVRVKFMSS